MPMLPSSAILDFDPTDCGDTKRQGKTDESGTGEGLQTHDVSPVNLNGGCRGEAVRTSEVGVEK